MSTVAESPDTESQVEVEELSAEDKVFLNRFNLKPSDLEYKKLALEES